jgi:hypothetical protein
MRQTAQPHGAPGIPSPVCDGIRQLLHRGYTAADLADRLRQIALVIEGDILTQRRQRRDRLEARVNQAKRICQKCLAIADPQKPPQRVVGV